MQTRAPHLWRLTPKEAVALQERLRERVMTFETLDGQGRPGRGFLRPVL